MPARRRSVRVPVRSLGVFPPPPPAIGDAAQRPGWGSLLFPVARPPVARPRRAVTRPKAAVSALSGQLSPETCAWIERTSTEERRRLGQYMTPRVLRDELLDQCDFRPGMRVLDPGVGTGEFLRAVAEREPGAELHGWDVDRGVLEVARTLVPEAQLTRRSALDPWAGSRFDLVVGNPPYFQFRASPAFRQRFAAVISGRPNIFALFFQIGIEVLRPGGQLAFVVPPSMNNGAYFDRLRETILKHCAIEYLSVHTANGLFPGAQTAVQILVLRRGAKDSGVHSFRRAQAEICFRRTVFAEDARSLKATFEGRKTLFELGYEAVTGSVVWNQHREKLRRKRSPDTVPLVWPHTIRKEFRIVRQHRRPAWIKAFRQPLTGKAIVVNRITGSVGSGEVRCALIPAGTRFLAENHVNVIRRHGRFDARVGWTGLLTRLREEDMAKRVQMLTGNTQVSATELTHLLPV